MVLCTVQDDLPPPVRESQERMLAMLKGDHQDNQRQIKEQRMQKKYRMVRFFGMLLFSPLS